MAKSDMIEVKGGNFGTKWEITANEKNGMQFTKDSPDNYKEGYYVAVNEMTGKDGPFKIHSIQTVNPDKTLGEVFSITAGKVLDDKMAEIKLNSFIGIEYLGRHYKKGYEAAKNWSQNNSYHIWFVGQQASAPDYNKACEISAAAGGSPSAPVQSTPVASTGSSVGTKSAQVDKDHVSDEDLPF